MSKVKFIVEVEESLLDCTNEFYTDLIEEVVSDHLLLGWSAEDFKVYVEGGGDE